MITREVFKACLAALVKQEKKEIAFADFMEDYLDGRCVPTLSTDVTSALIDVLSAIFQPDLIQAKVDIDEKIKDAAAFPDKLEELLREKKNLQYDHGWIDWWIYENDFGENKSICAYDKDDNEIILNTVDELYDFLIKNMNDNGVL